MTPPVKGLEMSRDAFLDLISGVRNPDGERQAELLSDLRKAAFTLTVSAGTSSDDAASLWIGPSHTTVVTGPDPVAIGRIRSANTPLALIGLLGLVRDTGERPPGAPSERWWRVRLSGPGPASWEIIDRSPGGSWLVVDDNGVTRVEPTTVAGIVRELCDALLPALGPL